jgi:hypothetical protein
MPSTTLCALTHGRPSDKVVREYSLASHAYLADEPRGGERQHDALEVLGHADELVLLGRGKP